VTTVKPSGTISQLAGVSSGMHFPTFQYAIRRMRVGSGSAICKVLQEAGVPNEPDSYSANTTVFEFPIDQGKTRKATSVSAWEQFAFLAMLQREWSDNMVSCCLTAGHYVHTAEGFIDIADCAADREHGFHDHRIDVVSRDGALTSSDAYFVNGKKETLKVTLDGGISIRGTHDHKLLTLNREKRTLEWKKISEITTEDYVVRRVGMDIWPNSRIADDIVKSFEYEEKTSSNRSLTLPRRMSRKFAYWLGCLVADGTIEKTGDNYVALSQLDNNVLKEWCEISEELFGVAPSVRKDTRTKSLYTATVTSRKLARFLKFLGVYDEDGNKQIPPVVMKSGKAFVKSFIRGLTLDGHVSERHATVMSSKERKLLIQLDALLANMGITGSLQKSADVGERRFPHGKTYQTQECYAYVLGAAAASRFNRLVGFAEAVKIGKSEALFGRRSVRDRGHIPDMGLRRDFRKAILPTIKSKFLKDHFHSYTLHTDKELSRDGLLQMADLGMEIPEHLVDPTLEYKKVKTVEEGGLAETFDISVPETNAYLVNGYISHNTVYFDPKSEGHQVEHMLAQFAPVIKSVSMLPHSETGAYAQMPYEGISREEYEERVAAMPRIDWERFGGSDGIEHKFCSNDSCEL
jgi:intein/homing endonuclease